MHPDEVPIDEALVRSLVGMQFPNWADLPLAMVRPTGTDNALYRLGADLVVRLPRRPRTALTLEKEIRWLPWLAPQMPVAIPLPVAGGRPAHGYPFRWAVYRWLDGEPATPGHIGDPDRLASDLAGFMKALQGADAGAGPPPGEHNFFRGAALAQRDPATRAAIKTLRHALDVERVTAIWESALNAPEWPGPPVWVHGDLDARNLLVGDGRLSGVLDFGGLGVGDPACDVMVAWKVLPAGSRPAFLHALNVDEATRARARGWALSQALIALAYYTPATNPVLVRDAEGWLEAALSMP